MTDPISGILGGVMDMMKGMNPLSGIMDMLNPANMLKAGTDDAQKPEGNSGS